MFEKVIMARQSYKFIITAENAKNQFCIKMLLFLCTFCAQLITDKKRMSEAKSWSTLRSTIFMLTPKPAICDLSDVEI